MRKVFLNICAVALLFTSCGGMTKLAKCSDYDYKYEAAKAYYADGMYGSAATLLEESIAIMKGTDKAEESLYLLAMCNMKMGDYDSAAKFFTTYYNSYPKGKYTALARFNCGKALYSDTPNPRLDQTSTIKAISELQNFIDYFPESHLKDRAEKMQFELQDKLVEKDFLAAKLYFDLGGYFGNCTSGGNNYQACIITAQNALKDYPYSEYREDLYYLILKSKYNLAAQSVESKQDERYRDAIDEYYGFKSEFPESKYTKEVDKIFKESSKRVKN